MLEENTKIKIKKASSKIFISDVLLKLRTLSTKEKEMYSNKIVETLKLAYNFKGVDINSFTSLSLNVEFERLHKSLLLMLMDEEIYFELTEGDLSKLGETELFYKLGENDMSETLAEYYKSILNSISLIELHTLYSK